MATLKAVALLKRHPANITAKAESPRVNNNKRFCKRLYSAMGSTTGAVTSTAPIEAPSKEFGSGSSPPSAGADGEDAVDDTKTSVAKARGIYHVPLVIQAQKQHPCPP